MRSNFNLYDSVGTQQVVSRIMKRLKPTKRYYRVVEGRVADMVRATEDLEGQYSLKLKLKALRELCVTDDNGQLVKWANRLVVATAVQPSVNDPENPVLLEVLGGSFRTTEADALACGVPIGAPRLISRLQVYELRGLKRVIRWAKRAGLFDRRVDGPRGDVEAENASHTIGRKSDGKRKLSDLVQYHHYGVDDGTHIERAAMLAQERAERTIQVPMFSMKVMERRPVGFARLYIQGPVPLTRDYVQGPLKKGARRAKGHQWSLGYVDGAQSEPYGQQWPLGHVMGDPLPYFDFEPVRWFEAQEYCGDEVRATGRDDADVAEDIDDTNLGVHESYKGVMPLGKPSRDENALWKRPRYRLDDSRIWMTRFTEESTYERLWKELPWVRGSNGDLKPWFRGPDGKVAEKGKSYFHLRSSFSPAGPKVKYWEKKFFPSSTIQTVEAIRVHPDDIDDLMMNPAPYVGLYQDKEGVFYALGVLSADTYDVDSILSDRRFRGSAQLAWKGGNMVFNHEAAKLSPEEREKRFEGKKITWWRAAPPSDVSSLGSEALGMIRGAIEGGRFAHVALDSTKDYTAGQAVWAQDESGKWRARTVLKSKCFSCEKRWGIKEPREWVMKAHAWICPICGSERARVVGRVWVSVDLLPFLPVQERLSVHVPIQGPVCEDQVTLGSVQVPAVTHVELEIFGSWLGELIHQGHKVDGLVRPLRAHSSRGPAPRLELETVTESVSHPKWVDDLLEADSKNSSWFWAEFKSAVLERHVSMPARKAAADKAVAKRVRYLAVTQRRHLRKVYGRNCMVPA